MYSTYGRLTGISGMVEKVVKAATPNVPTEKGWELNYLCGIYAASFLYIQLSKDHVLESKPLPIWMYILAGLFVGFGSRLGCGCTSGHGISGLARLSKRSFVGVGSFFVAGVVLLILFMVLQHMKLV